MAKKSFILKNWPKYIMQWGVLTALIAFISGLIPTQQAVDPEAYCPMGGLQAFATYLANDSLPCSMTSLQIMMGAVLLLAVMLFSKLFCGYICPLGTVQDLIVKLRTKIRMKSIKVRNGSVADKALRIIKYILLFWIFYMTVEASELFCKNFDPYYAIATGFKGELTLWMSIVSVCVLVIGSLAVDMFWCRYICPLGAISNSFKFWSWMLILFGAYAAANLLGAGIPWAYLLGAFCVIGYFLEILNGRPKLQIFHITKNEVPCNKCGLCERKCPYHIDLRSFHNGKINHVDCTLCGECVAACPCGALSIGTDKPTGSKAWRALPPVLAIALVALGMWFGNIVEIPTIDMKWNTENVSHLETMEVEGFRSIKCFGSAMTFKAKLQEVEGVHGVRVYVKRHGAEILYNPEVTTQEAILKEIYTPSRFRIQRIDTEAVPQLKCVTVRTEGMYDRYDITYLGFLLYQTGHKFYALETEFACPLIVRIYMDPTLDFDGEWYRNVIEKDEVTIPVKGGGTSTIALDYSFVRVEDGVSYISSEELLSRFK